MFMLGMVIGAVLGAAITGAAFLWVVKTDD